MLSLVFTCFPCVSACVAVVALSVFRFSQQEIMAKAC